MWYVGWQTSESYGGLLTLFTSLTQFASYDTGKSWDDYYSTKYLTNNTTSYMRFMPAQKQIEMHDYLRAVF